MCPQKIFHEKKNEQKKMPFKRILAGKGGVRKKRRFIGPRQFIGPRTKPPGFSMRALLNQRTGGFIGLEKKFFDTEVQSDAFATTWASMEPATTNLTVMAQGDGESNRDGRKYTIHSIHIRGWIQRAVEEAQAGPGGDSLMRLALVVDKQTNGATITATNVYDGGGSDDIFAFRNLQHTTRYTVLKDKQFRLNVAPAVINEGAVNSFASGLIRIPFKFNHTFPNGLQVNTKGTTADIANVTTNSIHLIGVSSSTTPTINYQCRVRFSG